MPISVDRRTGETINIPEITQQQKDEVWKAVVRKWIEKHPDEFKKLVLDQSKKED